MASLTYVCFVPAKGIIGPLQVWLVNFVRKCSRVKYLQWGTISQVINAPQQYGCIYRLIVLKVFFKYENDWLSFCSGQNKSSGVHCVTIFDTPAYLLSYFLNVITFKVASITEFWGGQKLKKRSHEQVPFSSIFVYSSCLISIRNTVSDRATNKSVVPGWRKALWD